MILNRIIKNNFYNLSKRSIVTNYKTLVEMQEKSCLKHEDRPLFGTNLEDTNWITYQEWGKNVNLFRTVLNNFSIGKGDCVAIISNNCQEWAVSAYATYSLGGVFVPMYQTQLEKDWKFILNDSKSKVLIFTDKELFKKYNRYLYEFRDLNSVLYLNNNYKKLYDEIKFGNTIKLKPIYTDKVIFPNENDLATIIYTSGTTGNPKGVKLTHKNIVSNLEGIRNSFPDINKILSENDRTVSFLPWAHCYGQNCELNSTLVTGSSMYLSDGPDNLVNEMSQIKPTLLFSVPALFNKMYDTINKNISESTIKKKIFEDALKTSKKVKLKNNSYYDGIKYNFYDKYLFSKIREKLGGRLKHSFVGGAATPIEVLNFFEYINLPIIEGYGLTETSPMITLGSLDYPDRKLGSVGKPLPENEVLILSENLNILYNGSEGEIITRGPNIMLGYHKNKEETDSVFIDINNKKYFRTGDIGYLDSENRLFITGRKKEQYKLENGKFVVPTILEGHVVLSPYIKQVIVYGENRPYNIALIVPDYEKLKHDKIDLDKLDHFYTVEINFILKNNNIKNYEIPRDVLILDEELTVANGFLTPKMSIKRNKVIEEYIDKINELYLKD
jgi:long-chain acyl-CoA synthetase